MSLYTKRGTTNHANVAACDVKLGEAAKSSENAANYFHQAPTIAGAHNLDSAA
jgi:hypothetical protein